MNSRSAIGEGVFEGLTVTLVGGSGADNQVGPDVVAVRDPETASAVWRYGGGEVSGVAAEVCTPHRSLHLGFGLEGVADAADRRNVLSRGIDWLITEPPTTGLRISRSHQSQPGREPR